MNELGVIYRRTGGNGAPTATLSDDINPGDPALS